MKDVRIGLDATIDTRNGIVPGRVTRIDPAAQNGTVAVDVALLGPLPPGARAELSVDGTIEIDASRQRAFMSIGRFRANRTPLSDFSRLIPMARARTRVNVKFGRASVNTIEVLGGLNVGDRVILSDMSQYDSYPRIRLN